MKKDYFVLYLLISVTNNSFIYYSFHILFMIKLDLLHPTDVNDLVWMQVSHGSVDKIWYP